MQQTPLANLYNYEFTFEQMVAAMFGEQSSIFSEWPDSIPDANIKNTRQMFLKLLANPFVPVPDNLYGSDVDNYADEGFVHRIFRGDNNLGMGRPKFLSDQLFNKALFGSVYQNAADYDESGPSTGAGFARGFAAATPGSYESDVKIANDAVVAIQTALRQPALNQGQVNAGPSVVANINAQLADERTDAAALAAQGARAARLNLLAGVSNGAPGPDGVIAMGALNEQPANLTVNGTGGAGDVNGVGSVIQADLDAYARALALPVNMNTQFAEVLPLTHAVDVAAAADQQSIRTIISGRLDGVLAQIQTLVRTIQEKARTEFANRVRGPFSLMLEQLGNLGVDIRMGPAAPPLPANGPLYSAGGPGPLRDYVTAAPGFGGAGDRAGSAANSMLRIDAIMNEFSSVRGAAMRGAAGPLARQASLASIAVSPSVLTTARNLDLRMYPTNRAIPGARGVPLRQSNLTYMKARAATRPDNSAVVQTGPLPLEQKARLGEIGKVRFDTYFIRKLFHIVNVHRILRLKLNRELTQSRDVLVSSHMAVAAGITEYGVDPFLPNESYSSLTNDRFDLDSNGNEVAGRPRGLNRFADKDTSY